MNNRCLEIRRNAKDGKIDIFSSDGIFNSIITKNTKEEVNDYFEEKATFWLESNLGNFYGWSVEDRKTIANKWLNAKNLSEGKYNYYFNLGDLKEDFRKEVASLAKSMGINYTLEIK